MTLELLAADIARRIPEMARDSAVNNEAVITRLIRDWIIESTKEDDSQWHLRSEPQ